MNTPISDTGWKFLKSVNAADIKRRLNAPRLQVENGIWQMSKPASKGGKI